MDWSKGYSSRFTANIVDPNTWGDSVAFEISEGSISRDWSSQLVDSASVTLAELPSEREEYIRIWLDARQAGEFNARIPLFTGLTSAPSRNLNGDAITYSLDCYSVIKPAEDVLMPVGWYAPSPMPGAEIIYNLLKTVCRCPIEYDKDSPSLKDSIVAESGETYLSMATKIADSIKWDIRINGRGEVKIQDRAEVPIDTFSAISNDIVELDVTDTFDWYSCPNVLRVTNGTLTAIARNDDPESRLSTVSRGREIWMEESSPALKENETLEHYASKKLKDLSDPLRKLSYTRRFLPDIYPGDVISFNYPKQDLQGIYRINTQNITLSGGLKVSEDISEYREDDEEEE